MQNFKDCVKESTLKSYGLWDWYNDMSNRMKNPKKYKSKYTPEERDRIMREAKVGPYRTWQFDKKRFDEIAESCYEDRADAAIKAGVTYLREKYPEYDELTDEEVVIKGLHKILYRERMQKGHELRSEKKEAKEADYADFML